MELGKNSAAKDPENTEVAMEMGEYRKTLSEEAIDRIRAIRLAADSLYITTEAVYPSSALVKLASRSFQQARQFTGKLLQEKGAKNPYPESMNPESPVIEERRDKGSLIEGFPEQKGTQEFEIAAIKFLRSKSADLETEMSVYIESNNISSVVEGVVQSKVLELVMAGKMWLGERLGEIRDQQG